MKKFLSITLTMAMLLASVIGVSAYEANADGFVTIEVDGEALEDATLEGEYSLVVVKGLDTEVIDFSNIDNILYIDQATAENGTVSFGEIGLKDVTDATAFIGGKNLNGATTIGNITIASAPETTRMPGDVNDSDSVTMRDANLIATAVVAQDFSTINVSNADVNESDSVTMRDANLIATAVVAQDFSTLK